MSLDNYAEVGRAVSEGQLIEEAFRQILRANFTVARRHLAAAQVDHFGQKPWQVGFPPIDAEGRQIVYKDERGFRFTVDRYYPTERQHAHVRLLVGYHGRRWDVYARGALEAVAIAREYALGRENLEPRPMGAAWQDGEWVVLHYEFARPPLD